MPLGCAGRTARRCMTRSSSPSNAISVLAGQEQPARCRGPRATRPSPGRCPRSPGPRPPDRARRPCRSRGRGRSRRASRTARPGRRLDRVQQARTRPEPSAKVGRPHRPDRVRGGRADADGVQVECAERHQAAPPGRGTRSSRRAASAPGSRRTRSAAAAGRSGRRPARAAPGPGRQWSVPPGRTRRPGDAGRAGSPSPAPPRGRAAQLEAWCGSPRRRRPSPGSPPSASPQRRRSARPARLVGDARATRRARATATDARRRHAVLAALPSAAASRGALDRGRPPRSRVDAQTHHGEERPLRISVTPRRR